MRNTKSAADLIKDLNEADETESLEAKTCEKSVGKSVFETICAFSNEPDLGGGTLLLGVEKELALFPLYTAVGVEDPDKISSDIASACATMFNIPIRVDIRTESVSKRTVLRIVVPELPKTSKPLYFKATGLPRGAFRRIGPTDVRCTDEDLPVFYQGKASSTFDSLVLRESSWADIDPKAVKAYRLARADTNPHSESLSWSDQELLHALGAIRYVDDVVKVTNAGLINFGTSSALRRLMPAVRVDYVRVPGKTWVPDPEAPFESIDMRGSLLTLVSRVMSAIADDLPKAFRLDADISGQRQETPVVPLRVLREAVVNALMHRSYQHNRPIQVLRFSNRIIIQNPGYSLKSQDRFDEAGSEIRNPLIAEVLHETRFAETKGSGIRVMRQKMAQSGLAAPTFESDRDSEQFTTTLLFHHFLDEGDIQWLSHFSDLELTSDQTQALIFVREVGAISNSIYRSLCQSDTLTASKSLRSLRAMKLLLEQGSGAKTTYVPGPLMVERLSMDAKGITIHGSGGGVRKDNSVRIEDLPANLRSLARQAQLSARLSPEKGFPLVEALCRWRPMTVSEIAELIGRSPNHVSQKYIAPLVADGRLSYTIPEMPQHPSQKYACQPVDTRSARTTMSRTR